MGSVACPILPPVTNVVPENGIGWAIRRVRKAQKRTLEDVANAIGSDAGNLSRMERGSQEVTTGTLRAIAGVLNVSVSDLWRLAEGGDPGDSGKMLALTGQLRPELLKQLIEYGEYLRERQSD